MDKITVVCHKDHDRGYEDYVGKCLLCEVERLQKREWVELAKEDMPDGDNPMFDTNEFYAGMAWAAAKLKEKNT